MRFDVNNTGLMMNTPTWKKSVLIDADNPPNDITINDASIRLDNEENFLWIALTTQEGLFSFLFCKYYV